MAKSGQVEHVIWWGGKLHCISPWLFLYDGKEVNVTVGAGTSN